MNGCSSVTFTAPSELTLSSSSSEVAASNMVFRNPLKISPHAGPSTSYDLDHVAVSPFTAMPSPSITPSPQTDDTKNSKTHAFFSSPHSARSPGPWLPSRTQTMKNEHDTHPPPARSRTAEFFGTSSIPPTPPLPPPQTPRSSSPTTTTFQHVIKPAAPAPFSQPKPKRSFVNLDVDGVPDHTSEPTPRPPTSIPSYFSHKRPVEPTIPPPPPTPPQVEITHATPADEDAELLFSEYPSSISSDSHMSSSLSTFESESSLGSVLDDSSGNLGPGAIIRSMLPTPAEMGSRSNTVTAVPSPSSSTIPLPPTTDSIDVSSSSSFSLPVTLRLTKSLGQGTFSSVWLAQDLSPTPLLLKSKQSLRDLKRKESSKGRGSGSKDQEGLLRKRRIIKSSTSSSNLMRRLRGSISGTRPGGGPAIHPQPQSQSQSQPQASTTPIQLGTLGMEETTYASMNFHRDTTHTGGGGSGGGLMPPTALSAMKKNRFPSSSSLKSIYLDERDGDGYGFVYSHGRGSSSNDTPTGSGGIAPSVSRASSVSWKSISSDETHNSSLNHARYTSYQSSSSLSSPLKRTKSSTKRLVAVKLTARGAIESDGDSRKLGAEEKKEMDRIKVSFVREVEILKHVSHPNITPLLSHLTTKTHHVLVLPYLPGGDLLNLINSDDWYHLSESILRKMFSEISKAVGWMHGVGLVHRDIKLENILLTTPITSQQHSNSNNLEAFGSSHTGQAQNPLSPQPLIKLTDFGLSRFIDTKKPLLTTRCGSEAYAAPELIMGGGRNSIASSPITYGNGDANGGYDARETDAWACGVVLYGLVGRRLPFGEGPGAEVTIGRGRDGHAHGHGHDRASNVSASASISAKERRSWLMKIARGEWYWPEHSSESSSAMATDTTPSQSNEALSSIPDDGELKGPDLVKSEGAKRIVGRLLVRDPSKRAKVWELWDDKWMDVDELLVSTTQLAQAPPVPSVPASSHIEDDRSRHWEDGVADRDEGGSVSGECGSTCSNESVENVSGGVEGKGEAGDEEDDDDDEDEHGGLGGDGWLVDKDAIPTITQQEVH